MIKGLGFGLDEVAKAALLKARFKPATRGGRPVASRKTYKVHFVIE